MSYSRDLGAWDIRQLTSRGTVATVPQLQQGAQASSSLVPRVLLVGAIVGAGYLVWRKLHKKAPTP